MCVMYVMNAFMQACKTVNGCMHVSAHACMYAMYVCMHLCMYICICIVMRARNVVHASMPRMYA